jgi:hypothetical protein
MMVIYMILQRYMQMRRRMGIKAKMRMTMIFGFVDHQSGHGDRWAEITGGVRCLNDF